MAQRVCVVDEGRTELLGVPRCYLRPQPVREVAACEWVAQWQAGGDMGGDMGGDAGGSGAAAAGSAAAAADLEGARLELAAFVQLLTSEAVCVWGECHNIKERQRLQKQREDADEYARNPPKWQFWKWEVFGGEPSA